MNPHLLCANPQCPQNNPPPPMAVLRPLKSWLLSRASVLLLLFSLASLCPSAPLAIGAPPFYSRKNMPNTSFTCDDKTSGGYYADPEAECQMFHVCVRVSEEEVSAWTWNGNVLGIVCMCAVIVCFCFVGLPFFPSASWPLSFLSLFLSFSSSSDLA